MHFIKFVTSLLFKAKTKQLEALEKHFETLRTQYEHMQTRFDKLLLERDDLKARFTKAVQEVQQKAGIKNTNLEVKVMKLETKAEGPQELIVSCAYSHYFVRPIVRIFDPWLVREWYV